MQLCLAGPHRVSSLHEARSCKFPKFVCMFFDVVGPSFRTTKPKRRWGRDTAYDTFNVYFSHLTSTLLCMCLQSQFSMGVIAGRVPNDLKEWE